ncbi:hypothetical protein MBLNU230_g8349t1 [Neophaeotheca triangularis]
MSNYSQGQQDNNPFHHQASTNPWESEQGHLPQDQQHPNPQQPSYQPPSQPQPNPWGDGNDSQPYQPPSGPSPNQQYSQPHQRHHDSDQHHRQQQQQQQPDFTPQPPRRTGTESLVPESERGEQREAMEQFELSRGAPESQADRDVATLQREFPDADGALIAALYGDSKDLGATREMLRELSGST